MGLDVGGVFADAGLRVQQEGFRLFNRRMDEVDRRARDDVVAHGRLDTDSKGFKRYNDNLDHMDRNADRATKSHGRLTGVIGATGPRLVAAGTGLIAVAGGATLAGKAFVGFATDVNESLTKNQQLFGKHAAGIDKWSKQTATSLGISRKEALDAAGSYGSLFETIGLADKPAANMSMRLTTLAGDLASFNNASPEEAMEALRSGLIGEAEPMRRFGALLSETRVQQEAWSSGIAENGTALTEQQKVQARYQLILKDTNAAQGDFHRTSGGLANQLRILRANAIDLGTKIGGYLLPPVLTATKFLNDLFGSTDKSSKGAEQFAGKLKSIGGPLVKFWGALKDEVGKAVRGITREFQGVSDDLGRIARAAAAYGELLLAGWRRALPGLRKVFVGMAQIVRGFVEVIAGILTLDFGKAWDGVKDIFGGALKVLLGNLRAVTAPFREAMARVGRALSRPIVAAWDFIKQAFKDGLDFIAGGASGIVGVLADLVGAASKIPGIGGKFKGLADDLEGVRHSIDRYRESLRKTDDEHEKGDPVIRRRRRQVRDLRGELGDLGKGTDDYRTKAAALRRAEDRLSDAQRGRRGAARVASRALQSLGENVFGLGQVEEDVFDFTKSGTNKLLESFGAKRIEFAVQKLKKGWRGPGLSLNARGGMYQFGMPGEAGPDSMLGQIGGFNVAVAPGEVAAVLTRHHQAALDDVFSGVGGFAGFMSAMSTPHGYQTGGIVPIPGQPGESISAGILGDVLRMIRAYRLRITDGYAPTGHAAGGEHPLGLAIDAVPGPGGSWGLMDKAMRDSGYPNPPNPPFRWLGWNNEPGHGVGDHGHWSWLRGRAGFSPRGLDPDPPRLRITGPAGPMRTIAQGSADTLHRAADRYVDRRAAASLPMFGSILSGSAAENRALGRSLAGRFGWRGAQFSALDQLWQGESGWSATATNPSSGAFGIPQALPPGKMGARAVAGDARAQILWGLRYIRDTYGSPIGAYNAWASRAPHWYQRGGLVGKGGWLSKAGRKKLGKWRGVVNRMDDRIGDIGNEYELKNRRFDLTEESFINEGDEDTAPTFNMRAIRHRFNELATLIELRQLQVSEGGRMVAYLKKIERLYKTLTARLNQIIGHLRGRLRSLGNTKEDKRAKQTLGERLDKYVERRDQAADNLGQARDDRETAGFELRSTRLDVAELRDELNPLAATLGGKPGGLELPDFEPPVVEPGDTAGADADVDAGARADAAERGAASLRSELLSARQGFAQLFGPGDIGAGGPTALAAARSPYATGGAGAAWGQYATGPGGELVGSGPVVYVTSQSLIPGGPDEYRKVGEAVTVGLGYQPYQIATIERQG